MNEDLAALEGFGGVARLFPLPNLVLFPHVIQPLHIFEQRYRQMTADALAHDRLIALVLLQPGWESEYEGRPAIHSVACLGRIITEQRLPDGRYNLLLRGVSRARIKSELKTDKLYRSARVELLPDGVLTELKTARLLRRRLSRSVTRWVSSQKQVLEQFHKLLDSELPVGVLCDVFSFALPLDVAFKQELLEEMDVEKKVRLLVTHLKQHRPPKAKVITDHKFPPDFSNN